MKNSVPHTLVLFRECKPFSWAIFNFSDSALLRTLCWYHESFDNYTGWNFYTKLCWCKFFFSNWLCLVFQSGLYNISLPRFTGTVRKRFCFFGCFTSFRGEETKARKRSLCYSYQLVVINSYFCLHAAVPLLYAPAYNRGCSLVNSLFRFAAWCVELKEAGPQYKEVRSRRITCKY